MGGGVGMKIHEIYRSEREAESTFAESCLSQKHYHFPNTMVLTNQMAQQNVAPPTLSQLVVDKLFCCVFDRTCPLLKISLCNLLESSIVYSDV